VTGDWASAVEAGLRAYRRLMEALPREGRLRCDYARFLEEMATWLRAAADQQHRLAAQGDPYNGSVLLYAGLHLSRNRGEQEAAVLAFRRALRAIGAGSGDPATEALTRVSLGQLLRALGRRVEALAELRQACGPARRAGMEQLALLIEELVEKEGSHDPCDPGER
jgi:tetratricopeptide (TPR) repeat protein